MGCSTCGGSKPKPTKPKKQPVSAPRMIQKDYEFQVGDTVIIVKAK